MRVPQIVESGGWRRELRPHDGSRQHTTPDVAMVVTSTTRTDEHKSAGRRVLRRELVLAQLASESGRDLQHAPRASRLERDTLAVTIELVGEGDRLALYVDVPPREPKNRP